MDNERKMALTEQTLKRAALEDAHAKVPKPTSTAVADFYLAVMIEVEFQLMPIRQALLEGSSAVRALAVIDHAKTHRVPDFKLTAQLTRAHHELERATSRPAHATI